MSQQFLFQSVKSVCVKKSSSILMYKIIESIKISTSILLWNLVLIIFIVENNQNNHSIVVVKIGRLTSINTTVQPLQKQLTPSHQHNKKIFNNF